MSKVIEQAIETSATTVNLIDADTGENICSFTVDPTDLAFISRFEEVRKQIKLLVKQVKASKKADILAALNKFNEQVEAQMNYLFAEDMSANLFSHLSAITILPSGQMYAVLLLEKLEEIILPTLEERSKKMQKTASKYTTKYHN